jgi:hypothetical protein
MTETEPQTPMSIPWAMHIQAVSAENPLRLVRTVTGAILGCGGWVLSRSATDAGKIRMVFEFERRACLDIYSVLMAAGVELSRSAHLRLTELCQCTRSRQPHCVDEIASVEMEISPVPGKMESSGKAGAA